MNTTYNIVSGVVELPGQLMARILVLGKSEGELSSITASIAGMNHFVKSAWNLDSLSDAVANGSPDLVAIDLRSGGDNLAHAKDLIANYDQVGQAGRIAVAEDPELPELQSKYLGDFILYPYDEAELAARIIRMLSKSQRLKSGKLLTAEGLVIDTESFEVSIDGKQLALTFKEFELLRYLAAHPGRVHTREALLNRVWGYEYFGGLRTVDVHVRRIRSKIGPKYQNLIQTVHGVGYKFVAG